MKTLIVVAFIATGGAAVMSHARILSAASMIPPILFGMALVLTLLHLIHTSDRRY